MDSSLHPLLQAKGGPGDHPPCTLYDVLCNAVHKWGDHDALAVKRPKPVRACAVFVCVEEGVPTEGALGWSGRLRLALAQLTPTSTPTRSSE